MAPPREYGSEIEIARSIRALRARVDGWRNSGDKIAFAPTMGALHAGHLSLIDVGKRMGAKTVASIFVNPRQFAAHEDLSTYPRTEARDCELLADAGCDLAFIPPPEEMYPAGFQTAVSVGPLAQGLCGSSRPHFFGGVATVVCKLLNQCRPDAAIFGEKDYQQLLVIRRMARDLDIPVDIVGAPIVREPDGLAMSSRNAYLTPGQRKVAGRFNRIIAAAAVRLAGGEDVAPVLDAGRAAIAEAGFDALDYLETRSAAELTLLGPGPVKPSESARVFAAVVVGGTRLIDNWPVDVRSPG